MAGTETRKFVGDVVWVGLGQLFMSLTGLIVLPAITKNYPAELYGVWSQMVVTIGFLRIMTMKFESAMIRFLAAEDDRGQRRQALSAMFWPIIGLAIIIFVISTMMRQNLSLFLFTDLRFANYVPLVIIWASLDALFFFTLSYQRAMGYNKRFSVIRLASSIARMLAVVSLAMLGLNFYWLIVSVIIAQVFFVIVTFILIFLDLGFLSFNLKGVKTYLAYSLPLLPGEILYWVIHASDRYFISHLLNITQTGIYAAAFSLANLLMLLSWPIGTVLFPSVSRLWERGDVEKVKGYFKYSTKFFLLLAVPSAMGLFILSKPLLNLLATAEFQTGGGLLVLLLALSVVFAGAFLINEYIYYLIKKTVWLALINAIGAIMNVILNVILIPDIGIMGAAISTVASYFIITLILIIWGRRKINYDIDFIFIIKIMVAAVIMTVSLWYIDVNDIIGIILVAFLGLVIYGLSLYFLKVFSQEDKKVIKDAFTGLKFIKPDSRE